MARSGLEVVTSGHGWAYVSSRLDRKQAVYIGRPAPMPTAWPCLAGVDLRAGQRPRLPHLLKHNARMADGHFAIRVLRGEEYFVVIENLAVEAATAIDPQAMMPRCRDGRWSGGSALSRPRPLLTRSKIGRPVDGDRRVVGHPDRCDRVQIRKKPGGPHGPH